MAEPTKDAVETRAASLSGPEKAVLLLLSLDETAAAPIVAELDASDIKRLREVASGMRSVPSSALDEVYDEFVRRSQVAVAVPKGGLGYLRKLSSRALGETATQEIFEDSPPTAVARVAQTDPATLAGLLEGEHPQLIAVVLSQLAPEKAADVLESLPEHLRSSALKRLGALSEIPTGMLEEVASALLADLPQLDPQRAIAVNGVRHSAQLVRNLSKEACEAILGEVESDDEALAKEIRRAMYSFEDLKLVDPKSMRELLKSVPGDRLTMALKTASTEMRDHIFGGMSKRAAERIQEDLEILGAVRLSEVEDAQREIVEIALRLESEGSLSLGSDGEALV
jgi:flagellar motor switch protein FliG